MSNTVLVTGGSGYFGSLLVRRCLRENARCRVFDLNDAGDRPPEVEFIRGDIRDYAAVRAACEGMEVIHHNVAQVPLAKSAALFESVNAGGTENLLRAALEARARKVVYTSSSAVFGAPKTNPVTEETPPAPAEAYGRAKLAGEQVCARFVKRGVDATVIRPRTILGHGRLGIFQVLFEWIREGANVPVLGSGENLYQFVHADDLADACILAGRKQGPGLYNCGAEQFGTMREALQGLCEHARTDSKVKSVPMLPAVWAMKLTGALGLSPLGPYHALMYGRSLYFDISKAKRELNWRPKHSNAAMLAESYDWYLSHREQALRGEGASHHRSALRQGALNMVKWFI